jgi:23S rRNA pseudouridine1911/1915/1917 synthase
MPDPIILHAERRERLDKYIAAQVPELSRSAAQRLIDEGLITVNAQRVDAAHRLRAGDRIIVRIPEQKPSTLEPEPMALAMVYEDDDLLVIDKPAGLVVHPSAGHATGTLVHGLLAHAPDMRGVGDEQRPGIVHRLDKDTSGLIVIAKHDRAHRLLQKQFQARTVKKRYVALVEGKLAKREGVIDAPIGRDPVHRKRMQVSSKGRAARTRYKVARELVDEEGNVYSLVDAYPETGRTHQIRVHLTSIGHPIAGDTLYGRRKTTLPIKRHFLHAAELTFDLPSNGERRTFSARLPGELARVLEALSVEA